MKIIAVITSLLAVALLWLVHESRTSSSSSSNVASRPYAPERAADQPLLSPSAHESALAIEAPAAPIGPPPTDDDVSPAAQGRRLQARFDAERTDGSWAATARQEVHDDLGRYAGDDIQIQNVECRASLCRVDLAFSKPDAGTAFLQTWLRKRTWTGPGFAQNQVALADRQPDGPQGMVVFLGKPGSDL